MILKFIDSPNYFMSRRERRELLEPTRCFFGGYIGFDMGYDLFYCKEHELQLLGGVGYDGFSTFNVSNNKNSNEDIKDGSVNSFNFNIGVGYRFYMNEKFYIGLRAKYNIVNYKMSKIIDFTGNPITVSFTIGGFSNLYKSNLLKSLNYKNRR